MTRGDRNALAEGLNFLAYGTYADRRPVRAHPVSPQARRPAERPRTSGPAPGRSEPGQRWSTADWCPARGTADCHCGALRTGAPARGRASATPRRLGLSGPSFRRRLRRVQARHQLVAVFRAVIAQLDALEDEVVTLTEPEVVVVAPTEPEVIVVDD